MLERKLYKTKLCVLYQRGHCTRQSCSFAHGDAELRRFSGSFNGRRDYRGSDLRDKLERRHSPQLRYSSGRDPRGRHALHGYRSSRSPEKRSERKHRKQHIDGQSDISGSLKISDGTANRIKDVKLTSHDSKDVLEEQLKQMQLDIEMLDDHKCQLEMYLEETAQEAESLTSRIEDLETQLNKEQEDCKRITSKVKKFIRAYNNHSRLQEQLKRSQVRLQKLGDKLGSDARPSANEEDSSVNIISDGEPNGNMGMSPQKDTEYHNYSSKKRSHVNLEGAIEEANPANVRKGFLEEATKLEKFTRWNGHADQPENNGKDIETLNKLLIENNSDRFLAKVDKHKRIKTAPSIPVAEKDGKKMKGAEMGPMLPSTSMAAHAADDLIEAIEMEEKVEMAEAASMAVDNETTNKNTGLPFLPPPPPKLPKNAYSQYEDEDENVTVEIDEMGEVDVNSEVDIEQL